MNVCRSILKHVAKGRGVENWTSLVSAEELLAGLEGKLLAATGQKLRCVFRILLMALALSGPMDSRGERTLFHYGASVHLFPEMKAGEVVSTFRVWVNFLIDRENFEMGGDSLVFQTTSEMCEALKSSRIDMVSMLTEEFFELKDEVDLDGFHFACVGGEIYEEYLVLVHAESGLETIEELKGKQISFMEEKRLAMGWKWLETLLMEQGHGPLCEFAGKLVPCKKSGKTVLGVFFGQVDACIIPRRSFETIVELNPQVGKQLTPLMVSPQLVPGIFCMRGGYDELHKQSISRALMELKSSPRGQQILTVFKYNDIAKGSVDDLAVTCEWIQRHRDAVGAVE